MKKILFPTDFSEASNKAFIYALQLAEKTGSKITTLHVFRKPDISMHYMPNTLEKFFESFDWYQFESYKRALPPLREMAEENGLGHIEMVHVMREGDRLVDSILEVAEEDMVDMIVMSTTGAEGLKEIFLGSIAGEVLENANVPVLVVPEEASFDGVINKIAFTTAYKEEEKLALRRLLQWREWFDFELFCVNVDTAHIEFHNKRMDQLKAEFADVDKMHFVVLEGNDMFKVLTRYLDEQQIDILAMTTHKRNFLQELFEYSRTKFLSYHSKIPVLSYQTHILEEV